MKTLHAAVSIDLPADEFAAAELMVKVRPHWQAFLTALEHDGIPYKAEIATSETKTAAKANGEAPKRRGRRAAVAASAAPETAGALV